MNENEMDTRVIVRLPQSMVTRIDKVQTDDPIRFPTRSQAMRVLLDLGLKKLEGKKK